MKVDFYYWDMQCPLNHYMLELLQKYSLDLDVDSYNVKDDFALAEKQRMFFPTLTVVNGTRRYFSPISDKFLSSLLNNQCPEERPYIIPHGRELYIGEVVPLTEQNLAVAGRCTGRDCLQSCNRKGALLTGYGLEIFGFINTLDGEILGGVEYVPSVIVPYDIPRSDDIAFLTCAYRSSEKYDYKSAPLRALEKYLEARYFSKILAVTDEIGTFPNGNLQWFLDNGFKDEGVIHYEPKYCKLHLVSKEL